MGADGRIQRLDHIYRTGQTILVETVFHPSPAKPSSVLTVQDGRRFLGLKRGKSPLAPDRTHIHHILMRAGFNARQTLYIMLFAQMCLVSLGMIFNYLPQAEAVSFSCCLVFVLAYQLLMKRSWRFIRWNKRRFAAV